MNRSDSGHGRSTPPLTTADAFLVAVLGCANDPGTLTIAPPWTQQGELLSGSLFGEIDSRSLTSAMGTTPSATWTTTNNAARRPSWRRSGDRPRRRRHRAALRLGAAVIRLATLADLAPDCRDGQQQLAATYGDTVPPDPAGVEAVLTTLVTGAASVVFVAEQGGGVVGMIGLVRYPHPMSGVITAGEVTWWVEPAARGIGLALLRRAERWAAETGAAAIQMIAPATNARVGAPV